MVTAVLQSPDRGALQGSKGASDIYRGEGQGGPIRKAANQQERKQISKIPKWPLQIKEMRIQHTDTTLGAANPFEGRKSKGGSAAGRILSSVSENII